MIANEVSFIRVYIIRIYIDDGGMLRFSAIREGLRIL